MNEVSGHAMSNQQFDKPKVSGTQVISWLQTTQGIIAGIVAVLVVLPSLVNAGLDVYISLFDIPTTLSERNNHALFQKHFQSSPIHTGASVIRASDGQELEVKISVYENGDIYIEYGSYSQWFPFSPPENETVQGSSGWLMRSAYADYAPASPCARKRDEKVDDEGGFFGPRIYFMQNDYRQDNNILRRERIYEDGCKEILLIRIKNGKIINRYYQTITLTEEQQATMYNKRKGISLFAPQVLDLGALKQQRNTVRRSQTGENQYLDDSLPAEQPSSDSTTTQPDKLDE